MNESPPNSSRIARVGRALALSGMATGVAAAAAAYGSVVAPMTGFLAFYVALLLSVLALVSSLLGIFFTRARSGLEGRGDALSGLIVSGSFVAAVLLVLMRVPAGAPLINDFSTDLETPPEFVKARTLPANRGVDMSYPGEDFARQQRRFNPDLKPLIVDDPPGLAFDRALAAVEDLIRSEITDVDKEEGRIEAVCTSAIFRFVDDVVVRVQAQAGGSRVDVRSRSRDGKGDLGVNAARINAILATIKG
ncbi:MAG: DUF1499 domain-containing protein [Candidatus Binatia bacterium]